MNMKGFGRKLPWPEIPSWNMLGLTEENNEKSQDRRRPGRDSSRAPHKCKSRALLLLQRVRSPDVTIHYIVTYRPTARQRLDKHVPAEIDSWSTARCWVMRTKIRDNKVHPLLGNGPTNTHS
jgi:hypothetical protein